MEEADDKVAASISIAAELVKGMKELCQGVHIMALGWEKWVPDVLDEAGL
jgi:5,10-methylenetetrahydrofolate reductase